VYFYAVHGADEATRRCDAIARKVALKVRDVIDVATAASRT
jgi:hypothetical protein